MCVCVCCVAQQIQHNVCFHLHLHTWPAINYIFIFLRSSAGSKQAARTHTHTCASCSESVCLKVYTHVYIYKCEYVCVPFDWSGGLWCPNFAACRLPTFPLPRTLSLWQHPRPATPFANPRQWQIGIINGHNKKTWARIYNVPYSIPILYTTKYS